MKSKHSQRDGWGELISQYGRRVSPSNSSGEGELTSAGRPKFCRSHLKNYSTYLPQILHRACQRCELYKRPKGFFFIYVVVEKFW